MSGSNHDAGGKLDTFIGGEYIVPREAAAGTEEQRAVLFREKAAVAQVVPDEAIGLREAKRVAITLKFREAKSAAGPDVAVVIGSNHVNVEGGKAVRQAIVSDLWFSVDEGAGN